MISLNEKKFYKVVTFIFTILLCWDIVTKFYFLWFFNGEFDHQKYNEIHYNETVMWVFFFIEVFILLGIILYNVFKRAALGELVFETDKGKYPLKKFLLYSVVTGLIGGLGSFIYFLSLYGFTEDMDIVSQLILVFGLGIIASIILFVIFFAILTITYFISLNKVKDDNKITKISKITLSTFLIYFLFDVIIRFNILSLHNRYMWKNIQIGLWIFFGIEVLTLISFFILNTYGKFKFSLNQTPTFIKKKLITASFISISIFVIGVLSKCFVAIGVEEKEYLKTFFIFLGVFGVVFVMQVLLVFLLKKNVKAVIKEN